MPGPACPSAAYGLGAGLHKAWESHQLLTGQDTLHRLATPRVSAGPSGRDRAAGGRKGPSRGGIWRGTQSLGGGVGAVPGPLPIRAETPLTPVTRREHR